MPEWLYYALAVAAGMGIAFLALMAWDKWVGTQLQFGPFTAAPAPTAAAPVPPPQTPSLPAAGAAYW